MDLKTTEELVEIWRTNNHIEWSPGAFEVVRDLLLERLGTLSEQNQPIEDERNKQGPAEKLLERFEDKIHLLLLLDLGLYICLPFAAISLISAVIFMISRFNPESKITIIGSPPWYLVAGTLLCVPIIFLRKRAKSILETTKSDIIKAMTLDLVKK